ncbi:hypothetical protein RMQ97_10215 [Maricaulis sp. D1M11]|uniref:hypothetical protein n=1 Tax=Maricaulis sp. D1M11 TaxID=3076117 RepID=UPI0039B68C60
MIQSLIEILEWVIGAAFFFVGVDYQPVDPCAAVPPEVQHIEHLIYTDEDGGFRALTADTGCSVPSLGLPVLLPVEIVEEKPVYSS